MACRSIRPHAIEQMITIAVAAHLDDTLTMATGLAFYPQGIPAARPVGGPARRQRLLEGRSVDVCRH